MRVEISPTNKSIMELSSQTYSKERLMDIVEHTGTLNELATRYPAECVRKVQDIYRVSYLGDEMVAILIFNSSGDKVLAKLYDLQGLKCDFDNLEVGCSLNDVQNVDPNGEYLFLYTGRNDTPRISSHYTKDGYLITIEYDTSNIITSIDEELL